MKLREKIMKLLEAKHLQADERKTLAFLIATFGDTPLEGLLFPNVQAHIEGRFEWFYTLDGTLRQEVA